MKGWRIETAASRKKLIKPNRLNSIEKKIIRRSNETKKEKQKLRRNRHGQVFERATGKRL